MADGKGWACQKIGDFTMNHGQTRGMRLTMNCWVSLFLVDVDRNKWDDDDDDDDFQ
jgi:hypothetical protein